MGIRAQKNAAVLLVALFCSASMTIAAFGAANGNGQADPKDPANTSSVTSGSSSGGSSKPQTGSEPAPGSSSQGSSGSSNPGSGGSGVDVPSSEGAQVTVSLDFNGGAGGSNRIVVKSGTPVADLATPTRKGYKFSGWSSGGNLISSSLKLTSDIFLIAQWEKAEISSQQQQAAPQSQSSVDTHQSEVDAAASRADETISDPDTLSSQDWNALLTSSETSSSAAAGVTQGSSQSSTQAQKASSGGFSWLFILGLILIVLALGGIGVFIYLQFFSHPHGPHGPGGDRETSDEDSTIEFTDISSYSNQHHAPAGDSAGNPYKEFETSPQASRPQSRPARVVHEPVRNRPNPEHPKGRAEDVFPIDHTPTPAPVHSSAPAHSSSPVHSSAQERFQASARTAPEKSGRADEPLPKAQARPVQNSGSNFDWEKFFNEDE